MNRETMERALRIEAAAKSLRKKIETMKLAKAGGYGMKEEVIACGTPARDGTLNLEYAPIPETARRHVFYLWKREQTLRYNEMVRTLNQIGMSGHGLELLPLEAPNA